VIHDPNVKLVRQGAITKGPSSALRKDVLNAVRTVTNELWPSVPTIPVMVMGATDGRFLRAAGIQTYGISGLFVSHDDVRAHGQDERISAKGFYESQAFLYELVKRLAS
jgi:acetylornithine deacetylase/succinyl-diaminopimelate desuccinylase-like protein